MCDEVYIMAIYLKYVVGNMKIVKFKNIFSTLAILIMVTFVVSMFALPNTINAQENNASPAYRGTGQIISAHWEKEFSNGDAIDVFFADQLITPLGEDKNGLYINVRHRNEFEYPSQISVSDSNIVKNGREIRIEVEMLFANRENAAPTSHAVTIIYDLIQNSVHLRLDNHRGSLANWKADSFIVRNIASPYASATVTKDKGNTNTLKIDITEPYFDFLTNAIKTSSFSKVFTINNNAAGTYKVDDYDVYVDTKGNDQIRACYIVTK